MARSADPIHPRAGNQEGVRLLAEEFHVVVQSLGCQAPVEHADVLVMADQSLQLARMDMIDVLAMQSFLVEVIEIQDRCLAVRVFKGERSDQCLQQRPVAGAYDLVDRESLGVI